MNNQTENTFTPPCDTYSPYTKGRYDFGVRNVFKDGGDKPNKDRLKHAVIEMINRSELYCARNGG